MDLASSLFKPLLYHVRGDILKDFSISIFLQQERVRKWKLNFQPGYIFSEWLQVYSWPGTKVWTRKPWKAMNMIYHTPWVIVINLQWLGTKHSCLLCTSNPNRFLKQRRQNQLREPPEGRAHTTERHATQIEALAREMIFKNIEMRMAQDSVSLAHA